MPWMNTSRLFGTLSENGDLRRISFHRAQTMHLGGWSDGWLGLRPILHFFKSIRKITT
jgi:hypothetical protein